MKLILSKCVLALFLLSVSSTSAFQVANPFKTVLNHPQTEIDISSVLAEVDDALQVAAASSTVAERQVPTDSLLSISKAPMALEMTKPPIVLEEEEGTIISASSQSSVTMPKPPVDFQGVVSTFLDPLPLAGQRLEAATINPSVEKNDHHAVPISKPEGATLSLFTPGASLTQLRTFLKGEELHNMLRHTEADLKHVREIFSMRKPQESTPSGKIQLEALGAHIVKRLGHAITENGTHRDICVNPAILAIASLAHLDNSRAFQLLRGVTRSSFEVPVNPIKSFKLLKATTGILMAKQRQVDVALAQQNPCRKEELDAVHQKFSKNLVHVNKATGLPYFASFVASN